MIRLMPAQLPGDIDVCLGVQAGEQDDEIAAFAKIFRQGGENLLTREARWTPSFWVNLGRTSSPVMPIMPKVTPPRCKMRDGGKTGLLSEASHQIGT